MNGSVENVMSSQVCYKTREDIDITGQLHAKIQKLNLFDYWFQCVAKKKVWGRGISPASTSLDSL